MVLASTTRRKGDCFLSVCSTTDKSSPIYQNENAMECVISRGPSCATIIIMDTMQTAEYMHHPNYETLSSGKAGRDKGTVAITIIMLIGKSSIHVCMIDRI